MSEGTDPDPPEPSPPEPGPGPAPASDSSLLGAGVVRLAGAFYGLVCVFAVGYAIFDRINRDGDGSADEPFLGLVLPSLGGALSGIGVGLVIVGVVHIGLRALPAVEVAARLFARALGPLTWKQALLLALFSSVGEELLFRGALWPHLDLVGTTFLFALVHILPDRRLWGYPLFALVAGLLFGILCMSSSDSVFPPMFAHFTVNALNLWWLGKNHARLTAAVAEAAPADPPKADA